MYFIDNVWEWCCMEAILLMGICSLTCTVAMDHMLLMPWRWTDPGPAWPLLQVLKKDNQEFVARSYWDVLRRSASQVLFSDLAEVHMSILPSLCCPFLILLSCLLVSVDAPELTGTALQLFTFEIQSLKGTVIRRGCTSDQQQRVP